MHDDYDDDSHDEDAHDDYESPFRDRDPIENSLAETILSKGEIEPLGQMPWSSNATLLCDVTLDEHQVQAVYKPGRGERPLWDFPSGLYRREVACYRLATAMGWDLVPPTMLVDGPMGPGSLQLFVPCDFTEHYLTLREHKRYRPAFEQLTVFDVVANSTDRKSGHVLVDHHEHVWAIDNGLSFHTEFKLRTVLWDYADEPLPQTIRDDLQAFVKIDLDHYLADLLDDEEIEMTLSRARMMINNGRFPVDHSGRRWPWPLV